MTDFEGSRDNCVCISVICFVAQFEVSVAFLIKIRAC
jgi:hypothetical protein